MVLISLTDSVISHKYNVNYSKFELIISFSYGIQLWGSTKKNQHTRKKHIFQSGKSQTAPIKTGKLQNGFHRKN